MEREVKRRRKRGEVLIATYRSRAEQPRYFCLYRRVRAPEQQYEPNSSYGLDNEASREESDDRDQVSAALLHKVPDIIRKHMTHMLSRASQEQLDRTPEEDLAKAVARLDLGATSAKSRISLTGNGEYQSTDMTKRAKSESESLVLRDNSVSLLEENLASAIAQLDLGSILAKERRGFAGSSDDKNAVMTNRAKSKPDFPASLLRGNLLSLQEGLEENLASAVAQLDLNAGPGHVVEKVY
ncbi:hypothetical protein QQX98_007196 [Neonectria punicea]|uniref:Uncharacterized protein n=1 Tax=Neonectria punicea TaxID=979145 RepID=A0ABR1GZ76_9HYPO